MDTMAGMSRTCGCGEVDQQHMDQIITLAGWVQRRRDHGGLIFVDLRDRSGIVQLVMSPQYGEEAFRKAESSGEMNMCWLFRARSAAEVRIPSIRK